MRSSEEQFLQGLMEVPPPPLVEKLAEEPAARPITTKNLFSNPDTNPVVLDFTLLKQFKLEWITWLPDTLFTEIEQTFKTSIADVNRIKIQAAQTLHMIDAFWEEWEIFEKTIHALNGVIPLLHVIQPPSLQILLAGVDMANDIRKEEFSEEVARYCAAVFLHENAHYAPEPLSFCQPFITQPVYTCKDCGKKASALPPWDGLCESCAGHFLTEHPFAFKPDPERVERGWGKNVTVAPTYDPEPTRKRFEELRALEGEELVAAVKETADDLEAARLIAATDYLSLSRHQVKEQLSSLRLWLESA